MISSSYTSVLEANIRTALEPSREEEEEKNV